MLRGIEININGEKLYMLLSGRAFVMLSEKYGINKIVEAITESGAAGYDNTVKIAALLIEQAELTRRVQGYDAHDYPNAERLAAILSVSDIPQLRDNIIKTINLGLKSDDEKDISDDPALVEFYKTQKKTKNPE